MMSNEYCHCLQAYEVQNSRQKTGNLIIQWRCEAKVKNVKTIGRKKKLFMCLMKVGENYVGCAAK